MAELNQKFHCKKNGITEELSAYTTLDEVANKGLNIKLGGQQAYLAYDTYDNPESSQLNLKKPSDSTVYRVLKKAGKPPAQVTLRCFDVETESQISSVKFPVEIGQELYLNNENAPKLIDYDFVVMDGIKNKIVTGNEVFDVWYIVDTIPDRNKTDWSNYKIPPSNIGVDLLVNTYSATSFWLFITNNEYLTTVRRLNGSNCTDCSFMFSNCRNLYYVANIDTSKATRLNNMFTGCESLGSLDWSIDMSSCTNCKYMFRNCPIKNVHLKNVPRNLDLSQIGTSSYIVDNYID